MYNSQDIIIVFGFFLVELLFCIFLGPLATAVFLSIILLTYYLGLDVTELLIGLVFFFLFGFLIKEFNGEVFWAERVQLFEAILSNSVNSWVWLYYKPMSLEGFIGGGFCGFLFRVFFELLQLSPTRKIYRIEREEKDFDKIGFLEKLRIKKINNKSPFSFGGDFSIIGYDKTNKRELRINDDDLNKHMLITGTTGSGKTTTLKNIIESFIARKIPVIVIDGKGEIGFGKEIVSIANKYKRKSWLFSMTGDSARYNPLLSGGTTSNRDKVIGLRNWSEDYYKVLAQGYLQLVFSVLDKVKLPVTLLNLAKYLLESELLLLIREAVSKNKIEEVDAERFLESIATQTEAIRHASSLRTEITNLVDSEFGHAFGNGSSEDFSLPQVLKENAVAYFSLSALKFPEAANTVGKLILSDMKASLDPSHPKKILLVIDEFSTIAGEQVLNLLNQARSMGLHVILSIQSIGDLGQKIQKNPMLFIKQIFGNCNIYLIHRLNGSEDAEVMSANVGTKPSVLYTSQIEDIGLSGMGSARPDRGFMAHPDLIKSLKTGHFFYVNKNSSCRHSVIVGIGRQGQ